MNERMFDLTGKVAIVTGGNGGIGEGIALGLANAGSSIVIAARGLNRSQEAAKRIEAESGVTTLFVETDVRDPKSVQNMPGKVLERFGRIDILVNNAGVNIRKLPQDFSVEEWDTIVSTNLRGVFLCSQAVYPAMKVNGGKIINIGSLTSIVGSPRTSPYAATKGGVLQLTRSLAVAWAADNIQVNAILPGHISTPLTVQARKDFPGLDKHVLARTPAGRWGTPKDFAGPAVFLASHASDFVTGEYLVIDGGYTQALLMITEQ
ncbi:glucose 1-dehydrogenase [Chloroflexota bacterium]